MNILIVQNKILHYRKGFYNNLSLEHNVTVLHSGKHTVTGKDSYNEVVKPFRNFGPFIFQQGVIAEIRNKKYDAVVCMFDLHWINSFFGMLLRRRSIKFAWWGLDLGKNQLVNWLKISFVNFFKNPVIFYTKSIRDKCIKEGVAKERAYFANNTFDVGDRKKCYLSQNKKILLSVGSLDARKQHDILIKSFYRILSKISDNINLVFVGDGSEFESLNNLVISLGISDRVLFLGSITDAAKLLGYYEKSFACVSYGQAGLSVLQSFGFGVPYVTKVDAITGGEASNIIDGHNGFFCKSQEHLEDVLLEILSSSKLAEKLGRNAYSYYSDYCSIQNMSSGFMKFTKSNCDFNT